MLISVIIPAYNAEKTISTTLTSVISQSHKDLEILVIDDGSTDKTSAIVKAIDDPRIRLLSFENRGLPTARNRGITHASGELISFIDADDLWTKDKLASQAQVIQESQDVGVTYSWTRFIDESGQILYSGFGLNEVLKGYVYPEILQRNFIRSGSNILMRKNLVDKIGYFDPHLKSVEDWDYYIRLASITQFSFVPEYQVLYRKSTSSMTTNVDKMEFFSLIVIDRAFDNAPQEYQHLKKVSLSNIYYYLSKQFLSYDPFDTNKTSILKALGKSLKATYYNPRIIFRIDFLKAIFKLFLIGIVPKKISKSFWSIATAKFYETSLNKRQANNS